MAEDRFLLDARSTAGLLLFFEGRYDEVRRLADQSEVLFPDHPDAQILHAFCATMRGDTKEVEIRLKRIENLYGHEFVSDLKFLFDMLPLIGRAFAAVAASTDDLSIDDKIKIGFTLMSSLTKQSLSMGMIRPKGDAHPDFQGIPPVRFPPACQPLKVILGICLNEMSLEGKGKDSVETICTDPKKVAELERQARDMPIGFVQQYYSFALVNRAEHHHARHGNDRRHATLLDGGRRV